jgi:hypothetical protein
MADIRHAGADKDFLDGIAGHLGKQFDIVGIVGGSNDRLRNLVQVNLNDVSIFGIFIGD